MKKIIEHFYKQVKKISWLETPVGTIWKTWSVDDISGTFITPVLDIEEAPVAINLDIFDDENMWELIK